MPIYEYQCSRCGEVFEAFQKVNDSPLTQCKSCQGPVERLISHSSFQLKGSGWYLTDYARKSNSANAAGAKESGAKSSEDSGGAAKPASDTAKPKTESK